MSEKVFYGQHVEDAILTLEKNLDFSSYGKYWGRKQNKTIEGFVYGE